MQGLLILALIIAVVIFLMPMILGVVIFLICAVALMLLLARLGFLPGAVFKKYDASVKGKTPGRKRSFNFEDKERDWKETKQGWYKSAQDGEEVILPETALKKDLGADSEKSGDQR
jgi:hypothetical protein